MFSLTASHLSLVAIFLEREVIASDKEACRRYHVAFYNSSSVIWRMAVHLMLWYKVFNILFYKVDLFDR